MIWNDPNRHVENNGYFLSEFSTESACSAEISRCHFDHAYGSRIFENSDDTHIFCYWNYTIAHDICIILIQTV